MSTKKRKKGHLPPFIPIIRTTVQMPAWKALSYGARSLYHDLRGFLRVDNLNNGKVYRAYRDAGEDIGTKSLRSVQRWYRELEHYGFIVMTTPSCLGVYGDGVGAHWRITECPTFDAKGTHIAPTRDFDRWDAVLFDDPHKTESRIPKGNSSYPKGKHTGGSKRAPKQPKRFPKGYIDSAPSMFPKGIHNCLPPPTALWDTPTVDGIPSEADYHRMLSAIDAAGPEYLAAFGITAERWKRWRQGERNTARAAEGTSAATLATLEPEGHA